MPDDIGWIFFLVALVIMVSFAGGTVGINVARNEIVADCKAMKHFRHKELVIECKVIP